MASQKHNRALSLGARLRTGTPQAGANSGTEAAKAESDNAVHPLPSSSRRPSQRKAGGDRKIEVALVDARPLTRACVSELLTRSARDFTVLAFSNPRDLLSDLSQRDSGIDLILFNVGAACVTEVAASDHVRQLICALPDVPLVIISDHERVNCIVEALRSGVRGYVPTSLSPPIMIEALRLVHAGERFIPAGVTLQALEEGLGEVPLRHGPGQTPGGFTSRQVEVLQLLRQGKPNKIIADELAVEESTVKVHVRNIMKRLKATNRTQAVFLANQSQDSDETSSHQRSRCRVTAGSLPATGNVEARRSRNPD